jgi:hypothetical protein
MHWRSAVRNPTDLQRDGCRPPNGVREALVFRTPRNHSFTVSQSVSYGHRFRQVFRTPPEVSRSGWALEASALQGERVVAHLNEIGQTLALQTAGVRDYVSLRANDVRASNEYAHASINSAKRTRDAVSDVRLSAPPGAVHLVVAGTLSKRTNTQYPRYRRLLGSIRHEVPCPSWGGDKNSRTTGRDCSDR